MPLRLALAALLLAACSATDGSPDSPAADLPLLAAPFTLGTTLYGSADLDALPDAANELLDDADLGGFTLYVDWADLEATPGVYTLDGLAADLGALRARGLAPFVNLTVLDIEDYNLPDGLGDGAGGLAGGVALDDQAVTDRFGRLLDRVVPLVVANGGFLLGVGNEVDARLDGFGAPERDAYVGFVEAARARVHATEPQLAVGVTVTATAVRSRTPTWRALREAADVVPFNYGPVRPDFTVLDLDDVRADFREVIDAAGDGPLVIQELTCPNPASMGASDAWQRACFERAFAELAASPQVRFASVFTFIDFDAPTCAAVQDALFGSELDDLPAVAAERLADYLCGLGVVRADGSPRPAWDVIRQAAER